MIADRDDDDGWFQGEQPGNVAVVVELQRIRRRTLNRPIPVLVVAALLTALVVWRFSKRAPLTEAEVVIAITEGSFADRKNLMPVDELVGYVNSVLMPDDDLAKLIERRDLYPLRKTHGMQFAIGELREQLEVEIFRNNFLYSEDDDDDNTAARSVRIGLTVTDADPQRAFDIARDLAGIVIATSGARTRAVADEVTRESQQLHDALAERLRTTTAELINDRVAMVAARNAHDDTAAARLSIEIAALSSSEQRDQSTLDKIVVSPDLIADQISQAGMGSTVQIVEERRPTRPEKQGFLVVMVAFIVGLGALIGSALVLGAFDSRIHDSDDVVRLGLPILGHVPGFPGDEVGSLQARGVTRARVPWFLRWRSR